MSTRLEKLFEVNQLLRNLRNNSQTQYERNISADVMKQIQLLIEEENIRIAEAVMCGRIRIVENEETERINKLVLPPEVIATLGPPHEVLKYLWQPTETNYEC